MTEIIVAELQEIDDRLFDSFKEHLVQQGSSDSSILSTSSFMSRMLEPLMRRFLQLFSSFSL